MIIRGANLVDRFYTADGWTRSKVAELLILPKDKQRHNSLYYVIPRFNGKKEEDFRKLYGFDNYLVIDYGFLDCDYYAVYDHSIKFKDFKECGHEYEPFR